MAKWRFEKEGKPLLQANESPESFKKRVAAWERRTGRKYVPMEFGDEEKILSGKMTIGGWSNQTDYFNNDNIVNEQNIKASMGLGEDATYARSIERDKEMDRMKESGEKEYDQTSIQYAIDQYNKKQEEDKTNYVQTPSPTWGVMNDTDRVNKANVQIAINAANQNKKISEIGNKEYVTDYQTAVRNAGGPWGDVEQYYGEDVLDSAGNRVRKSNVFTRRMNEDGTYGDPMGVMTRRQRLAEDLKRQEAQNKAKPNLVQTPSPTWTVDPNKKQQPESTKVNVQESSVPSGTSFKPVALSPEYADSIFFDPENFAK
tara:strand:+ start:39 stop:983 length:945 start_codon:yes stop_codon:yes gene_type:complete